MGGAWRTPGLRQSSPGEGDTTPTPGTTAARLTWAVCRLLGCHLHEESHLLALGEGVASPDSRQPHAEEEPGFPGDRLLLDPLPLGTLFLCEVGEERGEVSCHGPWNQRLPGTTEPHLPHSGRGATGPTRAAITTSSCVPDAQPSTLSHQRAARPWPHQLLAVLQGPPQPAPRARQGDSQSDVLAHRTGLRLLMHVCHPLPPSRPTSGQYRYKWQTVWKYIKRSGPTGQYCTFLLASRSLHFMPWGFEERPSLAVPRHGLSWRHLKASTQSTNETRWDDAAASRQANPPRI